MRNEVYNKELQCFVPVNPTRVTRETTDILKEIVKLEETSNPYSLTFAPVLSVKLSELDKAKLDKYLKENFLIWFRTWVKHPIQKKILDIRGYLSPDELRKTKKED